MNIFSRCRADAQVEDFVGVHYDKLNPSRGLPDCFIHQIIKYGFLLANLGILAVALKLFILSGSDRCPDHKAIFCEFFIESLLCIVINTSI
jgi:hypothetical protein